MRTIIFWSFLHDTELLTDNGVSAGLLVSHMYEIKEGTVVLQYSHEKPSTNAHMNQSYGSQPC